MGMYVVLTAFLYQKGSSESKPINEPAPQDQDPRAVQPNQHSPWPVRKGGPVLALYERSLATAFFALFFASWALHAVGGAKAFNDQQLEHGQAAISVWRYATTSEFWFESMQNWQSEFIAVAAIVGLSIFLRQRGSAESKPVARTTPTHQRIMCRPTARRLTRHRVPALRPHVPHPDDATLLPARRSKSRPSPRRLPNRSTPKRRRSFRCS